MLRLFKIEYFKLKNSKYFWVLFGLFGIFLLAVPISIKLFIDYLTSIGEDFADLGIAPSDMPFFDFVDLWQNMTWIYSCFSIFLGFIMVISIANEYNYGTVKQNVIDGLSRRQFLWTKISFIIGLSAVVSLAALVIGLLIGFAWSPTQDFVFIVKHIEFIPAYFLHLVAFQLFCLMASIIIKRPGITIALLFFYIFMVEPILSTILIYKYKLVFLANILPIKAIGNIIPMPWTKYALKQTQTSVGFDDLAILLVYIALIYFVSQWIAVKKDLR